MEKSMFSYDIIKMLGDTYALYRRHVRGARKTISTCTSAWI